MLAACRRRVEPHRGLDAAEELQPKLLLLLNRQMFKFVQGFDTENLPAIFLLLMSSLNRQMFVQGVEAENQPALLLLLLNSLNRQRFVLGFDAENQPALLTCFPLYIVPAGNLLRQFLNMGHCRSSFNKQQFENIRKVQVPVECLQSRVQRNQFVLIILPQIF